MASFNQDGSILTDDGRTLFGDDPVTIGEFAQISRLLVPQKPLQGGWPFISGGGGGGNGNGLSPTGNGAQGAAGADGSQGAQGAQGPGVGAQGAQGTAGAQGAQGSAGAQGAQGTAGAQGAAGSNGAQGAQGSTGAQGTQGTTGAQGAQGTTGAQGGSGGLTFAEVVVTSGEFDTNSATFVDVTGATVGFVLAAPAVVQCQALFTSIKLQADTDHFDFYALNVDGSDYPLGYLKLSQSAGFNAGFTTFI